MPLCKLRTCLAPLSTDVRAERLLVAASGKRWRNVDLGQASQGLPLTSMRNLSPENPAR